MITTAEMSLNVKFVGFVKKRPCLYDSLDVAPKNTIQKAWEEIAEEMEKIYEKRGEAGISADDCFKKWKCLRRSYLRYLKNCPSEKDGKYSRRYYLEDVMKFLQPHLRFRKPLWTQKQSSLVSGSTYSEELRCLSNRNDKRDASSYGYGDKHEDRNAGDDNNQQTKEDSHVTSEYIRRHDGTEHNDDADFYSDTEDFQPEELNDFGPSWVEEEEARLKHDTVTLSLKSISDIKNNTSAKNSYEVPGASNSNGLRMISTDSSKSLKEAEYKLQLNNVTVTETSVSETSELAKKKMGSIFTESIRPSISNNRDVPVNKKDDTLEECQFLDKDRIVSIRLITDKELSFDKQSKGTEKRLQEFGKPKETKYINVNSTSKENEMQRPYTSKNGVNSGMENDSSEIRIFSLQRVSSYKGLSEENQENSHFTNVTNDASHRQLSSYEYQVPGTDKQFEMSKASTQKQIQCKMTEISVSQTSLLPNVSNHTTAVNIQQEGDADKSFSVNTQESYITNLKSAINTSKSNGFVQNHHQVIPRNPESNKADNFETCGNDKPKANAEKKLKVPKLLRPYSLSSKSKDVTEGIKAENAESTSVGVLGNIKEEKDESTSVGVLGNMKEEKDESTSVTVLRNIKAENADLVSTTLGNEEIQIVDQVHPLFYVLSDNEEQLLDGDSKNTATKPQLLTDFKETESVNKKGIKRENEVKKLYKNKMMKVESLQTECGVQKQPEEDSRNLFIQSLLPDIRNLSDNQFRSFRKKVSDIMMEFFNKD